MDFAKITGAIIGILILIVGAAAISSVIIWLLWPSTIPHIFPGLVESGSVVKEISFWASVKLSVLCWCLFQGSSSHSSSSD